MLRTSARVKFPFWNVTHKCAREISFVLFIYFQFSLTLSKETVKVDERLSDCVVTIAVISVTYTYF
jgi:hypothetical protein